ncbi:hypothetical protein DM01DRAFT_1404409 [Hesseltinella vesiculosa]|uniref:Uncharacterized protein n=1 Tax=Hesseltinella vesiculosa TaxID=101127 RepID=A0A1X2GUD0_9FUNG|nr:hypothetical protein DM01DRAFT_1404409 [Hesseltinella vesiculosa]
MADHHPRPKRQRTVTDIVNSNRFTDSFSSVIHANSFPTSNTMIPVEHRNDTEADTSTMMDHLHGAGLKLKESVEMLAKTSHTLKTATARLPRLIAATHMERTHELMTDQDIADARVSVAREGLPQLELLLGRASELITHLGDVVRETERKVEIQDNLLKNQEHTRQIQQEAQSKITREDQAKMADMQKEIKRYQHRQQELQSEGTEYDELIHELELELQSLDRQKEDMLKLTVLDDVAAEELELLKDLDRLNAQLQEKQKADARSNEVAMVIDDHQPPLTPEQCEVQWYTIKKWIEFLQEPSTGDAQDMLQVYELQKYLDALERDQLKLPAPALDEKALENNIKLLKAYCKTLMPRNNMGYIGERLIDQVFNKTGYQAKTTDQLLQAFPSARQKAIAQVIIARYPFFSN